MNMARAFLISRGTPEPPGLLAGLRGRLGPVRFPPTIAALAVLGVLASCGGGNGDGDGDRTRADCSRTVGTAQTVELRFLVADASTSERHSKKIKSALCARLQGLGLRDVQLRTSGVGELVARAPRNLEADVKAAAMPGRLQFYDWEPNVIGDRGPDRPFAGGTALFDAVKTASRATPRAEATDIPVDPPPGLSREEADRRNDTRGDSYYLFGPDRRPIAGPVASRDRLQGAVGRPGPSGSQVLKVPRGIVVVETERAPNQPETVQRLFVLEDDSELSGADIRNPEQDTDRQTQEPIVTMEFTDKGRKAFAAVTKRIAQRGSEVTLPPGSEKDAALQRFAITLDNQIVSLATIDFRENPEGIDGRTGAQINGIGSVGQTRRLARLMEAPPLPGELVPLRTP